MHQLHGPKQSMLEGQLPSAQKVSTDGFYCWTQAFKLRGCFYWLLADLDRWRRSKEDCFHHQLRVVLLQSYALQTQECRSHIPKVGKSNVLSTNREKHGGICKRYVGKEQGQKDHLDDLKETFNTLCKYKMKLNPTKCVFGVSSGKFLDFMVSQRGIEENP